MWNQFDVVQILRTKNIRFLSGPRNRAALPHGNWSVVGFMGVDVVLAKQNTIVVAPVTDIRRIAAYDLVNFMRQVKQVGRNINNIDMVATVSEKLTVGEEEARKLLLKYNLPYQVSSESEKQKALAYLRERGTTDGNSSRRAEQD